MTNISLFNGISPILKGTITLEESLQRIKSGYSKNLIEHIRQGKSKFKRNLPSMTYAGEFSHRELSSLTQPTGLSCIDFDHVTEPQHFKSHVFEQEFIHAAWLSPSGTGVKAIARIPVVESAEEYTKRFKALCDLFDIEADKQTSDISRLCFESYDPDILIREFESTSIFEDIETDTPAKRAAPSGDVGEYLYQDTFNSLMYGLSRVGQHYFEGNRNNYLFKLAGDCNQYGIPEDTTTSMMLNRFKDYPQQEMLSTIRSAYKRTEQHATKRFKSARSIEVTTDEDAVLKIDFPMHIFPMFVQDLIIDLNESYNYPVDYSAMALISTMGSIMGNKIFMQVKDDWVTPAIFWNAVIGAPGSKKSHPVKFMMKPLRDYDRQLTKQYEKDFQAWEDNEKLDPKNKDKSIKEPLCRQKIINNSTVEGLIKSHVANKDGLLLYKDELIGLIKSMGQYKGGGGDDEEFFLESFNNGSYKSNRAARRMFHVDNININIIGTIQPDLISKISVDNGFLHRFLFCKPNQDIPYFNTMEIDQAHAELFHQSMTSFIHEVENLREPITYKADLQEYMKIDKYLVDQQRSDDSTINQRSYLEKLKTYAPRMALVIKMIWLRLGETDIPVNEFELALDLVKYFEKTADFIFKEDKKKKEVKEMTTKMTGKSMVEKILGLQDKGVSVTKISKELDVSRAYIYKILSNNKNKKQNKKS